MRPCKTSTISVLLILSITALSCARHPVVVQTGDRDVIEIARKYRQGKPEDSAGSTQPAMKRPVLSSTNADDEKLFEDEVRSDFSQGNFDRLDQIAQEARSKKTRFVGGVWELYGFYDAVSRFPDGKAPAEADWISRLAALEKWESANPRSITARVALAEAYVNFAWQGRGAGYADSVTQDQWKLFNDRAETARSILVEAARLKEKCPYWYEAMQHVAMAQGWKKEEARELMEQAVLFEPGYYHYYREYAHFLDPRWYGEEGEAEAFAEEISNRVGGQEGAFLYFEIAGLLTCQCNASPNHMKQLSWPKIQRGYEALDQLYGVSNLKRNRFAYMAYLVPDLPIAREVMLQIGDNWDKQTWGSNKQFELVRAWAVGPRPVPGVPSDSIDYVSATPKRNTELTAGDHVTLTVKVKYELHVADSGTMVLVLQKDDDSPVWTGIRQAQTSVHRGTGEATLTQEFNVPAGTKMIRAFVPLVPIGHSQSSADLAIEYPVAQK